MEPRIYSGLAGRSQHRSTQLSKRSQDYNQKIQSANQYSMEKYGKPFDMAAAQSDYKYATTAGTQNVLKMINGMIEQGGAIDIAKGAAMALPKLPEATINKVFNAVATEFGSPEATNFHTAMLGLADEYSKVMGGASRPIRAVSRLSTFSSRVIRRDRSTERLASCSGISRLGKPHWRNNRYLIKQYGAPAPAPKGPPAGATHTAPGSDGKQHYTNAQGQDLGVAQ